MMLELKNISKSYGRFQISNVSLEVARGEYFVLLGRSGSGKSQLLELIAGLRKPDSGEIFLNNRDITREKIQNRKVGLVFQDYAIFPHLSVYDNIAYPLKMKREKEGDIKKRVEDIAEEVNISHLLRRYTERLSGGEKQRVAVARTLVMSPDIILLDEPMASIDTPLKDDLRRLLRKLNRSGITIMHVTHDYKESIRLADRVGVIHNGRIIQAGDPAEVFTNPANRFVARFSGIQNFYKVDIDQTNGRVTGKTGSLSFNLPFGSYGDHAIIMLRSEDISLSSQKLDGYDNCLAGTVREVNRSESGFEAYVDCGEQFHVLIDGDQKEEMDIRAGMQLFLSFYSGNVRVLL